MILHNLFKGAEVKVAVAATVAGTSSITGNIIDTHGYDGVAFVACYGTLTAGQVTKMKLQGDTDSAGGTMADILGSATAALLDSQSGTYQVIDFFKPTFRYIRPIVVRGTQNAVVDQVVAILYHGQLTPPDLVTNSPIASAIKFLVQAPAGTA